MCHKCKSCDDGSHIIMSVCYNDGIDLHQSTWHDDFINFIKTTCQKIGNLISISMTMKCKMNWNQWSDGPSQAQILFVLTYDLHSFLMLDNHYFVCLTWKFLWSMQSSSLNESWTSDEGGMCGQATPTQLMGAARNFVKKNKKTKKFW